MIRLLFRRRKPAPPSMALADLRTIETFARDGVGRQAAIEAHQRNIATVGVRGNLHQRFMAEIDNPCPDIGLRAQYRDQVLRAEL